MTSSSVLREYYEFERTSTAVIQGYLQPLVTDYADALVRRLQEWGFSNDALIMQSNGGADPRQPRGRARGPPAPLRAGGRRHRGGPDRSRGRL